jgi:hypothetical protein
MWRLKALDGSKQLGFTVSRTEKAALTKQTHPTCLRRALAISEIRRDLQASKRAKAYSSNDGLNDGPENRNNQTNQSDEDLRLGELAEREGCSFALLKGQRTWVFENLV